MADDLVYKIEPIEFFTYIVRFVSILVIFLCIFFFNINPLAFSIFMIISLAVLLFSRTSRIILTSTAFIIEHRNIIPKMSKVIHVNLSDIKGIRFEKEFKPMIRRFIPKGYVMSKDNEVFLKLHDGTEICQSQIGTKRQFLLMLEKLNEYALKSTKR